VLPPLDVITAWQRRGILSIRDLIVSWGISSHTRIRLCRSSSRLLGGGCWLLTRRPIMSQRCSIGFISGLQAGHSKTWILTLFKYSVTICAVCGLALSCIRRNPSPMYDAKGTTKGSKMSAMYRWEVRTDVLLKWQLSLSNTSVHTNFIHTFLLEVRFNYSKTCCLWKAATIREFCHVTFYRGKKYIVRFWKTSSKKRNKWFYVGVEE
jgi:hypothetical protein